MNISAPIQTAERVEAAARLIAAGQAAEAERLLKAVLARDPGHLDALNTLAGLALLQKNASRALDLLGPACTAFPDQPRLLANLGLAHAMLGQPEDGVFCLERAVALAPGDLALRLALGRQRAAAGDLRGAAAEIEAVLREAPGDAKALAQMGAVAVALGDFERAETVFRAAAQADPEDADVLANLAILNTRAGRHAEAAVLAERAHLRAPLDLGRQVQLARCQAMVGDFESAEALCRRILAVAPMHVGASELFGRIAIARGAIDSGIGTLTRLVRGQPKLPEAILALAGALRFAGRLPQALAFVDQALAIAPDHASARSLKTDVLLTLGRFGEVWPPLPRPEPLRLLHVPRGTTSIEALLFGRFIASLCPDGVALVSEAEPAVSELLSHVAGVAEVGAASDRRPAPGEPMPALQDLPRLKTVFSGESLAVACPYLVPPPRHEARWRAAFKDIGRPLIGIAWEQFAPGFPIGDLVPRVAAAGTPVSLAVGPERQQLRGRPGVIDAGAHIKSAADLIAAVSCLDFFVGPEGLALHVAGALGLPGLAILPVGAGWSVAAGPDRLLWHATLRPLAQRMPGRWDEVSAALAAALPLALDRGSQAR